MQDDIFSLMIMGALFLAGNLPVDVNKSISYYKKAASLGDVMACRVLAQIFDGNHGMLLLINIDSIIVGIEFKNDEQYVHYLEKVALSGSVTSMFNLGIFLSQVNGIKV